MKTTAAAAVTMGCASTSVSEPKSEAGQVIELRRYRLAPGMAPGPLDAYLEKAFIPAANERSIGAVGVFTEPDAKDGEALWVLFAHPGMASVISIDAALNADPAVQQRAPEYLTAPVPSKPNFERIDSWLFRPFDGMPSLAVPALASAGRNRVFEMRTYESFSELKALKKVAMFNAGEITLMQDLGLSPVFYGQALIGGDLPQLTYLLCSPDMETHKRNWAAFGKHPVWVKLKSDPQYADTVSKIVSRFLVPRPYSQI